jgi:hypothetical protein
MQQPEKVIAAAIFSFAAAAVGSELLSLCLLKLVHSDRQCATVLLSFYGGSFITLLQYFLQLLLQLRCCIVPAALVQLPPK